MERENPKCPLCGGELDRTDVDIGVGVISGPWGCMSCGWSEDPTYDCSREWATNEPKRTEDGIVDPLGGWRRSKPFADVIEENFDSKGDDFDGT